MMHIAVVEDDESDARTLSAYAEKAAKELGETTEIKHFADPVLFLEKYRADFDVVFMDIEMPGMNGLKAARLLREKDADVVLIFVTNMAQFALEGYEVDALDFIVKPVAYEQLRVKFARAVKRVMLHRGERIIVQGRTSSAVVSVPNINYIEVMNHRLTFHTADGNIEGTGSLTKLEDKLKAYDFSRCNACYLVNLDRVDKVSDGHVYIAGERLPVSRSRRTAFLRDLADHLGGKMN
mgnify:FL=1